MSNNKERLFTEMVDGIALALNEDMRRIMEEHVGFLLCCRLPGEGSPVRFMSNMCPDDAVNLMQQAIARMAEHAGSRATHH